MPQTLLDQLEQEFYANGFEKGSRAAILWFKDRVSELKRVSRPQLMSDGKNLKIRTFLGGMYFFFYDPKHKKTLPYYDRFPLVIPFSHEKGAFRGINLHYLDPRSRALLLNNLMKITTNKNWDNKTRMQMSWQMLKASSKFHLVKPAVKMYLRDHLRSKLLTIRSYQWPIATFLPVAKFIKASQQKVWKDSQRISRGNL